MHKIIDNLLNYYLVLSFSSIFQFVTGKFEYLCKMLAIRVALVANICTMSLLKMYIFLLLFNCKFVGCAIPCMRKVWAFLHSRQPTNILYLFFWFIHINMCNVHKCVCVYASVCSFHYVRFICCTNASSIPNGLQMFNKNF